MKQLPRIRFAQLPTAVEALPRLSAQFGGPQLFVKRDDQTGLAFGGNKSRKLEFLVAEAQANGARTLITAGAVQSNHCRQTAAAAARFGFDCILLLTTTGVKTKLPASSPPHEEDPGLSLRTPESYTSNLMLDKLLGAEIVWTETNRREEKLQETFNHAWQAGRRPYLIPYGGSNPVGASAYVYALIELLKQSHETVLEGLIPDWIVIPSSSGGTQAGLVLGAHISGYRGRVLGISIDEPAHVLKERVAKLAMSTAELLGERVSIDVENILVNDDYLGGGYGVMGESEKRAIQMFARLEGLLLDPVYTGRASAGLIDLLERNYFNRSDTILFWHTGGTPALFADPYQAMIL